MRDENARRRIRPVTIERGYIKHPAGSVRVTFGDTHIVCTATVEDKVPPFLAGSGQGWVTAEYAMLPGSGSGSRISRNANTRGRAQEISRLIGRSLRSVVNLDALGERQITVDCDVIQADGGTRTAAITGGYVALNDAFQSLIAEGKLSASPMAGQCAAVSVGLIDQDVFVDLCYEEDYAADVDLNLVMKDGGSIIEIQGTAEGASFNRDQLDALVDAGADAIRELMDAQLQSMDHE